MDKVKQYRRRSTLEERKTPCACCGYPLSHRHHLMSIASHGENMHTIQLCPNCHELFHLVQLELVRIRRESIGGELLRHYTEVKGMNDSAFRFMLSKALEVEELEATFSQHTLKITEAIRKELSLHAPTLRDIDIYGFFGVTKGADGVQFKVGAWVSEETDHEKISESLWVFHFKGPDVINAELCKGKRLSDGTFVPSKQVPKQMLP